MDDFIEKVKRFISRENLLAEGDSVLVALSGGADSVALTLALRELGYNLCLAHCNFHLRGEESMRDERFVRDFARRQALPLQVQSFDVPAYRQRNGCSVEMACRDLRYGWFQTLKCSMEQAVVAVGHHRDDNVETFFLNVLRETGRTGLSGMRPRNDQGVVRPLLCVSREEILEFLSRRGQDYVTDSTNLRSDVQRNFIRHEVIPAVERGFPAARERMAATMDHVREQNELFNEMLRHWAGQHTRGSEDTSLCIQADALMRCSNPSLLLYELVDRHGFNRSQCDQAVTACRQGRVGAHFPSASQPLVMTVQRGFLSIHAADTIDRTKEYEYHIGDSMASPVSLQAGICRGPFHTDTCDGRMVIALPADVMHRTATLRHWRDGDRFRPFGLHGTKLLSDLFTDLKLTREQKDATWLLELDGEIVWVLGYRSSAARLVPADAESYILLRYTGK